MTDRLRKVFYEKWLPAWAPKAACAGRDTDAFFVEEPSSGEITAPILAAKRICMSCDFRSECLTEAYAQEDSEYREGIRGGVTGKERERQADNPERIAALEFLFTRQVKQYALDLWPERRTDVG